VWFCSLHDEDAGLCSLTYGECILVSYMLYRLSDANIYVFSSHLRDADLTKTFKKNEISDLPVFGIVDRELRFQCSLRFGHCRILLNTSVKLRQG
jgi:hypothetical protein